MKITRENYEVYFIDLLDGTLSDHKVDELLDFMRDNPDLAEELKGLEDMKFEENTFPAYNYTALLKTDLEQTGVFEDMCVRSIEKELSEQEEQLFQNHIKTNEKAAKEYRLFEATVSKPNPFIVYERKDQLKKRSGILPFWYATAAVIVFATIFWFNQPKQTNIVAPPIQLAFNEEINSPQILINRTHIQHLNVVQEKPTSAVELKEEKQPLEALPVLESHVELAFTFATLESEFILEEIPVKLMPSYSNYLTIPQYLAQEINKIDTHKGVQKVGLFMLNKLGDITNNKLDYSMQQNGSVNQIQYNSRLLAFTIPVNSKEN